MKHGLKQEIKRGLSVLMAVSMVASSALPVMAEEVVEEAVEVETVGEEVADAEEDVVVDVADVEDVEEEVVEDVVVEEAADDVTGGADPVVPEHKKHTMKEIVDHKFTEVDATGKLTATIWYTCTGCDKVLSASLTTNNGSWVGDASGASQTWGVEYTVTKAATCKDGGKDGVALVDIQTSYAGWNSDKAVIKEEVPIKWAHTPSGNITIVDSTCTEDGHQTFYCTACQKGIENEVIPAKGHNYIIDMSKITWSTDGKSATVVAECQNDQKHNVEIDLTKYIRQVEEKYNSYNRYGYIAPTCTAEGQIYYYIADDLFGVSAAKNELKATTKDQVSVKGYDNTYYGFRKYHKVNLKKTTHEITDIRFNFKNNQFGVGSQFGVGVACDAVYTCKNCSGGTINAKVILEEEKTVKTTCQTPGKYYYYATVKIGNVTYSSLDYNSEHIVTENRNLAKHSFYYEKDRKQEDSFNVRKAPTCTEKGKGDFKCKYCPATEYNLDIPALGHSFGETKGEVTGYEATCLSNGRLFAECKVCGKTTANGLVWLGLTDEQKEAFTTKSAHQYEVTATEWTANKKMVNVTITCKCKGPHDNHATYTETLKATEKIDVPATGTTDGKKHYEAVLKFADCNEKDWEFKVESDPIVIPATGITELELGDITATYTGDRISAPFVKNNRVASEVKVKYYKDEALTQQYSGAPYTAGTYYAKATAIKTDKMTAAESNVVKVVIKKATPTVTVKASTKSVYRNTAKAQKINLTVTQSNKGSQKGKVTYSTTSDQIKVSSKGVITVKKGAKKGTYKVTVKVAATTNYEGTTKTISIKVK